MSDTLILEILKYAGFALAASAAIWGMIRKTTFEDPQGHKRLTPAGYVAIALALGSAMVGAGAFGIETVIKSQEKRARADEDARDKVESDRKEERNKERILLSQALTREAAAESRARDAKQESLALALGSQARARDLALAQNVSRGAAANLAKAEVALAEIGRVLQPAGVPTVHIQFRIDGPIPLSRELENRIGQLARKPPHSDWSAVPETIRFGSDSWADSIVARKGSPIYPDRQFDPALADTVAGTNVHFVFYAFSTAQLLQLVSTLGGTYSSLLERGHYSFNMRGDLALVEYGTDLRGITIIIDGEPRADAIKRSGVLTAVQDFEMATLVVYMDMLFAGTPEELALRQRMKPSALTLRLAGRDYYFDAGDFQRFALPGGGVVWAIDRIGSHRF